VSGKARTIATVSAALSLLVACASRSEPPQPIATIGARGDPFEERSPIVHYSLSNGLKVVLNQDLRAPVVAVRAVYRVGSAEDPPGGAGTAHLVEHLALLGGPRVGRSEHFEYLFGAGAREANASTTRDATDFWEVVPAHELAPTLWLESERMGFSLETLSEADLERERHIVELERAERTEGSPHALVYQLIGEELFPAAHPYHHTPGDTSLGSVKLAHAREFFRSYYGPNNAALVISGQFDETTAKRLVAHYFERLPPRPVPTRAAASVPALAAPRFLELEAPVAGPWVLISWVTPAALTAANSALEIVAEHLNRGALDRALVESGLACNAHATQHSLRLGSVFDVRLGLGSEMAPDPARRAVSELLENLAEHGTSWDELENARHGCLSELYSQQDDVGTRSWFLGLSTTLLAEPDPFGQLIRHYRETDERSFRAAVREHLAPDRSLTAVVTPNPQAPLEGRRVRRR
jgi:predicted Zn-dependent peptidase